MTVGAQPYLIIQIIKGLKQVYGRITSLITCIIPLDAEMSAVVIIAILAEAVEADILPVESTINVEPCKVSITL